MRIHSLPLNICNMIYTKEEPSWVSKYGADNDNVVYVKDFNLYIHAVALVSWF